ncbi:ATP-binding protein [Sulfurimonas sp. MAG313]|nr:ATP-binding protein [Sulfurimonas sp. MAG313]MDF1881509.1 ATP-binding protein [Sulfurimonas sp. MAG313]
MVKIKKLSQFSFFTANTEYEQIAKTLSNIFINSKLDSGSIKKSLVSSISGFEPLDLNHMRRNLGDFRVKYDDISSFSKNASVINEAVVSLGVYEDQTITLHFLAESLGANTKTGDKALNSLKEKSLALSNKLNLLDKEHQKQEQEYHAQHDASLKEQGVLEKEITDARAKQAEYERLNIKDKLELWDKKPLLKEVLITLESQLSKLLDSQSSLSERFEHMREREHKSFQDNEQRLLRDITEIEQEYNRLHSIYLKEKDERITKHRVDADFKLQGLTRNLLRAKEEAFSASSTEKILQNKSFDKEKIEQAKNEYYKATKTFEEEKTRLQLSQSELQKVAEQVFSAEQSKEYKLQNLQLKHENETRNLRSNIQELIKKKDLNSACVLGYMKEHSFENTGLLSALLKDEVLYSQELNPSFISERLSLLGLCLDTSSLDIQAYEESAITVSLLASEERLKRMNVQAQIENEEFENTSRNEINALRREQGNINTRIDELVRVLPRLETQSLSLAEHLQSVQNLAAKKKDEELSKARHERELKDKLYTSLKQEEILLREDLNKELSLIIKELSQQQEQQEYTKLERLEYKNKELNKIKTERDKQFEEIKKEEDDALVKGGVDASLLKKYQGNIEVKKEELFNIEAFSEIIAEYKIDKKRIFEFLDIRIKELEKLSFTIKEKEQERKQLKEWYEKEKTSLSQERDAYLIKVKGLEKDLKEYLAFKDSSLYTELSSFIEHSQLEANEDNVSQLINKLRDLGFEHSSSKDKLRKKLNKAFSSMSQNNIFNLYAPSSDTDTSILESAHSLKTFVLENKIETYKEQVAKEFTMTLRHLSSEIGELMKAEGDISKTVSRINKTLQDLQGIKVIRGIELKYKESDNLLLNVLKAIGHLVEQNPYGNEINLFSSQTNESFNEKALKHLEELSLHLGEEKLDLLTLDESFVLEFRAIENGNDTGFVPSLDGIGSNGTDVMVKAMVNIAMLSLARKQSSKKEASVYFHCILDEVGILSPAYLKELIAYANNKQIRFINGAPDEKLVSTYKRLYMLSTDAKHRTIVRKLVSQS